MQVRDNETGKETTTELQPLDGNTVRFVTRDKARWVGDFVTNVGLEIFLSREELLEALRFMDVHAEPEELTLADVA